MGYTEGLESYVFKMSGKQGGFRETVKETRRRLWDGFMDFSFNAFNAD